MPSKRRTLPSRVKAWSRPHAVGREAPELHLAGFVGKGEQGLPVGEEARAPVADPGLVASPRPGARSSPGRRRPGRGRSARPGRRWGRGGAAVRYSIGFLTQVSRIWSKSEGREMSSLRSRPGGDVIEPEIGAPLVDDASAGEGGALHVPPFVPGELDRIAPVRGHRPQVHDPVAVAHEVDAPPPPHRILACAGEVPRQEDGFAGSGGEPPDTLRRPPSYRLVWLPWKGKRVKKRVVPVES